jgi:hypothetical protein
MFTQRFVAIATLAGFLSAMAAPASAQTTSSPLRSSIDRAAKSAPVAKAPQRKTAPVRKAVTQGGGGGGGAMVMTIIGTLAGIATTYFVIKEMNKQTEEAANQQ